MKKLLAVILAALMAVSLAVPALAADYTASAPAWVTLDGVITEEEWGAPIYKGVTAAAAMDGEVDPVTSYWQFSPAGEETFDFYMTNNDERIWVGLVVHGTTLDTTSDGNNLWQHQNLTFTLSPYVAETTVSTLEYEGQIYESYTGFRVAMLKDGTLKCETLTQGLAAIDLVAEQDYVIKYDEATGDLTYEVGVPLTEAFTYIDITKDTGIAMSAVIALNYDTNTASASVNGGNRFLIGTGAAFCGGPANFAHKGQATTVQLNDAAAVAAAKPVEPSSEENSEESSVPEVSSAVESSAPAENGSSMKGLAVIIIIIAAVVILGAAVVLILVLRKKPEAKADDADDAVPAETEAADTPSDDDGKDGQ